MYPYAEQSEPFGYACGMTISGDLAPFCPRLFDGFGSVAARLTMGSFQNLIYCSAYQVCKRFVYACLRWLSNEQVQFLREGDSQISISIMS